MAILLFLEPTTGDNSCSMDTLHGTDPLNGTDPFGDNPHSLFDVWFQDAIAQRLPEPNAMTLATVGLDGKPSARVVLLKGFLNGRFQFFTNYESRKAKELDRFPYATLVFHWHTLERQIRIEGSVERLSREESEAYFRTRARDSQIGAWASKQSHPLDDRSTLINRFEEYRKQFEGQDVPLPAHWGGFGLHAERMEFWIGRSNRLHDRCIFTRKGTAWKKELLFP